MGTDLIVLDDGPPLEVDPVAHMAIVLDHAKDWLAQANTIEDVRRSRAVAVGYEAAIRERGLAVEAQLAATEIVRRCERRIGELVREGQANGTIRKRRAGAELRVHPHELESPHDAAGVALGSKARLSEHYAMADADSDAFEGAIAQAREEGNLSRANIVRKVKGEKLPRKKRHHRTADSPHYRLRHFDPMRVLGKLREEMETMDTGLEDLEPGQMSPEFVSEQVAAIRASWRRVNQHLGRLI